MTNSRQKGAAGEREFARYLTAHGFDARRGQQFHGGPDSPDVICECLPDIHFEVKRVERLNLYDAMFQAMQDAEGKFPIVAHRRSRHDWVAILPMYGLLDLLRETEYRNDW